MITVKTHIGPDQYGGKGIFASEPIKKGDVVWRYDEKFTRIFSIDEYKDLCAQSEALTRTLKNYCYPGEIIRMGKVEPVIYHDLDQGSFMNHDEDPNTGFLNDPAHPHYAERFEINIALRDIAAGEQMTYDYFEFSSDITDTHGVETCVQFLIEDGRAAAWLKKRA